MALTRIKPTTPGQRFKVLADFTSITKKKPEKSLIIPHKKKAGRNNMGRITSNSRGGGSKKAIRIIDFFRKKYGVTATVNSIQYAPMRSARIALMYYEDGVKTYMIVPKGLKVGDKVISGEMVSPEIGNATFLKSIPIGTAIHNIELNPGKGAVLVRSAGCFATVVSKVGKNVGVKLSSGEVRLINENCMATVGIIGNEQHNQIILGKAGSNRNRGRRPKVRGTAMNPVDHPGGGGEGKNSGGQPRSKTGLLAKGKKTRKPGKASDSMIIKRRK